MPDYNIPMSAAPAQIDARIPMQGDTRLPMAVENFKPVDSAANTVKAYQMGDTIGQAQENQDVRQDKARDKMILQQGLQSGLDLDTPEGLEQATKELKGKLSPDSYQNLVKLHDQKQLQKAKLQEAVSSMSKADFDLSVTKQEEALKHLQGPMDTYTQVLAQTKDEAKAQEAFKAAKMATIQMLSQDKDESGKPMYQPERLKQFEAVTPQQLEARIKSSKYWLDTAMKTSTIKLHEAQAGAAESRADKLDADVEQGAQKLQLMATKIQNSQGKPLSDDDRATMAEYVRTKGPQVLSRLGLNNEQRQSIMSEVTKLNTGQGITAREGAVATDTYAADKVSMNKMVPQLDAITAFEKTAEFVGGKLIGIAKKVDATGVPVLERWIRAGRKSVAGDADVTELNSRMQTFRTEAARILNNPNLVGVLSDSARHEIEEIMPNASSAEQIERGVNVLIEESKKRRDNIQDQINEAKGRQQKGAAKHDSVSPADQKAMDSDRPAIFRRELKATQGRLAAASTPEEKQRAQDDIDGLQRELKAVGATADQPQKAAGATPASPADINELLKKYGKQNG